MQYFFVLGRSPELSKIEINSVLNQAGIKFDIDFESDDVLIISSNDQIDIFATNNILGGTVKIGHIVSQVKYDSNFNDLLSLITKDYLLENFFERVDRKIHFGISLYKLQDKTNLEPLKKKLFNFQKAIKALLELNGIKSHYPKIQTQKLSSASVKKNKLLTHGAEIVLFTDSRKILVGRTDQVQQFENFSKRDYGRPERDMVSGTMPPKLARMMINILGRSKDKTILDPFCGSGTVLQEALLLGFSTVYGSDISQKAVLDSKKNIDWLMDKDKNIKGECSISQIDVLNLSKSFAKPVDTIVGEPYLGKTLKSFPTVNDAINSLRELEKLYVKAFSEFSKVLGKGGAVAIILPVMNTKRGYKYTNIFKEIEKLGFRQIRLLDNQRGTILVGDNRDFVLREIAKFNKI